MIYVYLAEKKSNVCDARTTQHCTGCDCEDAPIRFIRPYRSYWPCVLYWLNARTENKEKEWVCAMRILSHAFSGDRTFYGFVFSACTILLIRYHLIPLCVFHLYVFVYLVQCHFTCHKLSIYASGVIDFHHSEARTCILCRHRNDTLFIFWFPIL